MQFIKFDFIVLQLLIQFHMNFNYFLYFQQNQFRASTNSEPLDVLLSSSSSENIMSFDKSLFCLSAF